VGHILPVEEDVARAEEEVRRLDGELDGLADGLLVGDDAGAADGDALGLADGLLLHTSRVRG